MHQNLSKLNYYSRIQLSFLKKKESSYFDLSYQLYFHNTIVILIIVTFLELKKVVDL